MLLNLGFETRGEAVRLPMYTCQQSPLAIISSYIKNCFAMSKKYKY